jgi:deoxycytidylate deaminase
MSAAIEKPAPSVTLVKKSDCTTKRPRDTIAERQSQELVIAFAGPIGSGIRAVKDIFSELLTASGYKVHHIKISEYLEECLSKGLIQESIKKSSDSADRYIRLQDAGNDLRKIQSDILSEYAIQKIAEIRTGQIDPKIDDVTDYIPVRAAYLIDQLKHQDEVTLLRAVYGNLFYQFGILSTSARRSNRLKAEGIQKDRISELVERDRKQREKNGQQLDKALQLADFFIRNDHANIDALEFQIKRSIDLIHGVNGITPTKEEYGMYVAYSSGLRSACLSRQVGASIMNDDGVIIATGRNDVPKAGGGLYGPEDGKGDARCIKIEGSECFNDKHKDNVAKEIESLIKSKLGNAINELLEKDATPDQQAILQKIMIDKLSSDIADTARDDTRLGGLLEFSRSIHAEMDAIVSLAFKGGGCTDGTTLFTYTFPCHNCARHIVAAGIKRVYYLEPYEKSLALELHGDAIDMDGQPGGLGDKAGTGKRVEFLHFEGVAPRQYLNMFTPSGERKDNGKAVKINVREAEKKIPEYLDDYRKYELKVVEHLNKVIEELKSGGLPS